MYYKQGLMLQVALLVVCISNCFAIAIDPLGQAYTVCFTAQSSEALKLFKAGYAQCASKSNVG